MMDFSIFRGAGAPPAYENPSPDYDPTKHRTDSTRLKIDNRPVGVPGLRREDSASVSVVKGSLTAGRARS